MNVPAVVMDPSTPFKRLGSVSRLREFITPVEDVHVLAHLSVARVDPRQWQLRIDGMVGCSRTADATQSTASP